VIGKKKVKDSKIRKMKELDARKRAELILKVRSGLTTATAAAFELGVSRKTYYQWEAKAFDSMLEALIDKEPGRPALPPEVEEAQRLREFVKYQEEQIAKFEHRERLIKESCKLKIQLIQGRAEKKCGYCGDS
jgi:DNA-binding XRE family transcriptional regulator